MGLGALHSQGKGSSALRVPIKGLGSSSVLSGIVQLPYSLACPALAVGHPKGPTYVRACGRRQNVLIVRRWLAAPPEKVRERLRPLVAPCGDRGEH